METTQKRPYIEIINDIEKLLNTSLRGKNKSDISINPLLQELKLNFGVTISKEFLNNLMDISDNHKKTDKIRKMIKRDNLKVTPHLKIDTALWNTQKEVLVIDYGHKDFFGNILNIHTQTVGTEFIRRYGKTFHFIDA